MIPQTGFGKSFTIAACRAMLSWQPADLVRRRFCEMLQSCKEFDMANQLHAPPDDFLQRQRALARWENEGGRALPIDLSRAGSEEYAPVPEMTNAEIVALRVRVIALENVVISLLATAPDHHLDLVREMAEYISPRPGFTPHPLTIHAAKHMVDLVDRSHRILSRGEGSPRECATEQPAGKGGATVSRV